MKRRAAPRAAPFSRAASIEPRREACRTALANRPRQAGQSSVELAIVAAVLVPLLITVPLLGKYLDLAQTTEVAARYVVFEGTIAESAAARKSDATLAVEVRRRFFSRSDSPIKTGDAAGDFTAHRNPLWVDHTGAPLLADFAADVAVSTVARDNTAPLAALLARAGGFGLPMRNELEGAVTVRPRDVASLPLFDRIGLHIARRQIVLVDSWAAASSADLRRRIDDADIAVYPIEPLELIGDTVGTVLPPMALDPAMEVANTPPEIIPCDRLEGGC